MIHQGNYDSGDVFWSSFRELWQKYFVWNTIIDL